MALVAGMAAALEQSPRWTPADLSEESQDPLPAIAALRDQWMDGLLQDPRLQLTGDPRWRLPHHISFLVSDLNGHPLSGRALVRELALRGIAVSSGSVFVWERHRQSCAGCHASGAKPATFRIATELGILGVSAAFPAIEGSPR